MTANNEPYISSEKMRNLIRKDSSILFVMSRFGIGLGFGEKTVKEVCDEQGIDVDTFLAVANHKSGRKYDASKISPASLMNYLRKAHSYFLEFKLPAIRRDILEAIDCSGNDKVAFLILRFYDEYVTEVNRHMEHENTVVFSYVDRLLEGDMSSEYSIADFARKHNHIEAKLKELKNIIVDYYPQKNNDLLCSVLFDIINCEADLSSHCSIEDELFVPAVSVLEEEVRERSEQMSLSEDNQDEKEILSKREKEIIVCVTKGMSNKMIADHLNLSIHTVTTHRKNIAAKLQIKTQSGLTIYAIVNGLIAMDDVKMT